MNIIRRFKQFQAATQATISAQDVEFIRKFLDKQQQILFYRMPIFDQRHSCDVAYRLINKIKTAEVNQGKISNREDAVVAALLHDCGKMEVPFSLYGRCFYVIFKKFLKNIGWSSLVKLGQNKRSSSLLRNFYVLEFHHLLGAELLKQIGVKPDVIKMISAHHSGIDLTDSLALNLLKEADIDI
ncbi:MAG: HD domain-containing protein [Candidatus Margulisiibacteriota bacterium]|jgi:putative nucleotidyltransferase with HDIG domain